MPHALLLAAVLFANPAAPGCGAVDGWNDGRAGTVAIVACRASEYLEAHHLGEALHQLRRERDDIDTRLVSVTLAEQNALRRRQRQIDTDLEAIRGVATIKGWPLDIAQEITP